MFPAAKELLADGIDVLIYAGDVDYICNWLGNKAPEFWRDEIGWQVGGKPRFGFADVSTSTPKKTIKFQSWVNLTKKTTFVLIFFWIHIYI